MTQFVVYSNHIFSEREVVANRLHFTEKDIIDLLKQVPFSSLITFVTEGSKILGMTVHLVSTPNLLLEVVGSFHQIVRILKEGLITFNCMRFKNLIEYIHHIDKNNRKNVSRFWSICKEKVGKQDEAIMWRLQVEYDTFILRSVTAILSCKRYGVWKFISVILSSLSLNP